MRCMALNIGLAVACTILATALFPPCAEASDDKESPKKEMTLREKYALPTHVQLTPMMVPIRHSYQTISAITLFLEPVRREDVGAVCRNVPRIRDAVLLILSRNPIPTARNKLVLDGVGESLIGGINEALDTEKIKGIHVEAGMVNLAGSGGGISRLPFATINGCRGIKEIEEKLKAAKEKAKQQ